MLRSYSVGTPLYNQLREVDKDLTMPIQLIDSTELLDSGEALRARAAEDGYLFFRKLIPVEDILAVRANALKVVEQHEWLQPGQDELGGLLQREAFATIPESDMRTDIGVTHAMPCMTTSRKSRVCIVCRIIRSYLHSSSTFSTSRSWYMPVILHV